jgi:hypothetical protein
MFIIVSKYLIPKGYRGLTFFPFVFLKYQIDIEDNVLINHERIHLRQQIELLIFPFFIWYGIEFLVRFLICKNKLTAYKSISFEKEAYENEKKTTYLSERKLFSFLRFL